MAQPAGCLVGLQWLGRACSQEYESPTSARGSPEPERVEQEAEYVRSLVEEKVHRAEATYRRAVAGFLRADERYLQALAAMIREKAPPGITELLARRVNERARAVDKVTRRELEDVR